MRREKGPAVRRSRRGCNARRCPREPTLARLRAACLAWRCRQTRSTVDVRGSRLICARRSHDPTNSRRTPPAAARCRDYAGPSCAAGPHPRSFRYAGAHASSVREQSIQAMNDSVEHACPAASGRPAQRPRGSGRLPDVDIRRCTGCGRCVAACDLHLLSLETIRWEKFAVLHEADRCTSCNACAASCPFQAIAMRSKARVESSKDGGRPTRQTE